MSASRYGPTGSVLARRCLGIGKTPADEIARLGLAEDVGAGAAVAVEQRVAERVERPRPRVQRLQPRLELVLGELVVGDRDHGLAAVAAVGEEMPHPLGQDPRLARAGRRDDPRPARRGARRRRAGRGELGARARPVGGTGSSRPASTAPDSISSSAVSGALQRGPPSIQASLPSPRATSAQTADDRAEPRRLLGPPPDRSRRSGRRSCWPRPGDGAGRTAGRGRAASAYGGSVIDCGSRNPAGSTPSATTTGSRTAHLAWSRATAADGSASSAGPIVDPLGAGPAIGWLGAGGDDHTPAQLRRRLRDVRHCRGSRPVSSR